MCVCVRGCTDVTQRGTEQNDRHGEQSGEERTMEKEEGIYLSLSGKRGGFWQRVEISLPVL